MSVALYGQVSDYGSFANVTRAIAANLKRERIDASIYCTGRKPDTYVEPFLPIRLDNSAGVGIFCGYPESGSGWLAGHKYKVLVTVCETNKVPGSWIWAANQADLVVVPSSWCEQAFINSGLRSKVLVIPHGVWVTGTHVKDTKKTKTLLHVTGSLSFSARKGTVPLLRAWKEFTSHRSDYKLWLKMPYTEGLSQVLSHVGLKDEVGVIGDETYKPKDMIELLQHVDGVVQPSRAEGFGMVPLEARCLGTPAILTSTTGHEQHFAPCDAEIESGPLTPLHTQGNSEGRAPTVTADDVLSTLHAFANHYDAYLEKTTAWAAEHGPSWRWSQVLKPLMKVIREHDTKKSIPLGSLFKGVSQ